MKEIIITGSIALSGISKIIDRKYAEILEKYPERIIKKVISEWEKATDISVMTEACDICYASQLGEGGLFTGLWNMSKELKKGFCVDMKRVPVLQETIEICEMFNVNPYNLESEGAWLMVCEPSGGFREVAEAVGLLEDSNDKKLLVGDRVRFLDRPAPDELRKIL